jgi:hypothetical protein
LNGQQSFFDISDSETTLYLVSRRNHGSKAKAEGNAVKWVGLLSMHSQSINGHEFLNISQDMKCDFPVPLTRELTAERR